MAELSQAELADLVRPLDCAMCDGSGQVRRWNYTEDCTKLITCPLCKGAKKIIQTLTLEQAQAISDHLRRSAPPAEVREVVEKLREDWSSKIQTLDLSEDCDALVRLISTAAHAASLIETLSATTPAEGLAAEFEKLAEKATQGEIIAHKKQSGYWRIYSQGQGVQADFILPDDAAFIAWCFNNRSTISAWAKSAQEVRNAALTSAAAIVRGQVYKEHYRTWPQYHNVTADGQGNVSNESEMAKLCDTLAKAILALKGETK